MSVNYYVLQAMNYVEYFANFSSKSTAYFGTSENWRDIGKGHSNSDSKVQNHTEINSDSLSIKTKETTTVKGAVANINHLVLDTKNLHIESVQDTESYNSKQTQGGINGAVALIGEGASASAQFSQTKANVDYAQVAQQSGFNIRESSQINVEENTHLKGGVINAEGDKANHQLTTGTLTTESIENRSDVKVSSVSVGVSSDMSKMATSAMSAALSALGNMRESERSQTQSAISSNINIQITDSEAQKQKTGKTVEETLQSLNRDVANANQKLAKADLQAVQEKQETAQVIGELSQSWTSRLVQPHLDEANQKRQEADEIEKSNPAKAEILRSEARVIEAEYGLGSNLQMGIRAATAALQGLATGNVNQAAVGAVSPYLNKLIKEQTGDNKEANLIAHAVLGAVEAHVTGNNAAAGALGALTAEAAAPYLMKAMYGTDKPADLTESQKQNITNLSQIAAGLAGGLIGDSTADFTSGAEIGKRAVENNYLGYEEANDFITEYINSEDKLEVLRKYLLKSKENDKVLNKICNIDPVQCITLINDARKGTDVLEQNKGEFRVLSPYFSTIMNSNLSTDKPTKWEEFKWSSLIPSWKKVEPNQELANKLANAMSRGEIALTKDSADLLYQLNTDKELSVKYDPSNIKVKLTSFNKDNNRYSGRVLYSDVANWSVFGSVLANKRDNGNIHIYDDKYDFDIRGGIKNIPRDIETFLGKPAGKGTEYIFQFDRDKKVILEGEIPK